MTHCWKRFEEHQSQKDIPRAAPGGGEWAVIWDDDPKIYFAVHGSWGGSGWYADPDAVITRPEALSVEDDLKNQGYTIINKRELNDLLSKL